MDILLATHNFLPHHTGGTEIYVLNLAKFLIKKGHKITIMAAIDSKSIKQHRIIYNDNNLEICSYLYDELTVLGVEYKQISTEQIYSKKSNKHRDSLISFFANMHFDILHINGFTATIGLDLLYALKEKSLDIKIISSFHTAISDPKETLTFANTLTEQDGKINPTADVLSYRFNIPYWLTKTIYRLLPNHNFSFLPTLFNIKYLINQNVKGFEQLKTGADEWWVYSNGIRKHLIANGVKENIIKFERHGISSLFIGNKNIATKPIKFLFNGRAVKIKGLHTLLKSWLSLPYCDDKQLWITGERASNDPSIELLIKKSKIRKDVKWLGVLSQEQLAEVYLQVHTVIIPSECYEIGPLVFHEAIACECNVIASDIGGCKELAQLYHDSAVMFKTGNSTDLQLKIQSSIKNKNVNKNRNPILSFEEHFISLFKQSSFYD